MAHIYAVRLARRDGKLVGRLVLSDDRPPQKGAVIEVGGRRWRVIETHPADDHWYRGSVTVVPDAGDARV